MNERITAPRRRHKRKKKAKETRLSLRLTILIIAIATLVSSGASTLVGLSVAIGRETEHAKERIQLFKQVEDFNFIAHRCLVERNTCAVELDVCGEDLERAQTCILIPTGAQTDIDIEEEAPSSDHQQITNM